ncbi:MAG: V-type ATPase subunit [Ruthenibacterium sp.]
MQKWSALAIVPKAKHIGAMRLTREEYRELMRRRSVIEVVATLQNHPYFKATLGGIAKTNLHREQLEQALSKDVFFKYESLMRYSFRPGHFGGYFLVRCEINELLQKLRLISIGYAKQYIVQLPGFLLSKTSFNLLELAAVNTAEECCKVLTGTPYQRILLALLPKQGQPLDYLACEHALESYFYGFVLKKISEDMRGTAAADMRELFCAQAEIYNLDLLFRIKAFYAQQFTPMQLRALLLPVYGVLKQKQLYAMAAAPNLNDFLTLYNQSRAAAAYGARTPNPADASDVAAQRVLYKKAQRMLHFSSTPQTVLAAVLCLADLERSNIVTIIEGVRYGLAPESIEQFLKYA